MTKDEIKLDARELQLKTLFDKQQKREDDDYSFIEQAEQFLEKVK